MKKVKIGIDFDGVIADAAKLKSYVAEKEFGRKIYWANFKREIVVGRRWLTNEQYDKVSQYAYGRWRYGQLLEPVRGARFYLAALFREGHEILIVTSRLGRNFAVADRWLQENGFNFVPRIGIGYGKSKAGILQAFGADVYIDDDIDKLLELVGIVPHLFLFAWPWSEKEKLPSEIKRLENSWRVNPWKQFYLEICGIIAQKV